MKQPFRLLRVKIEGHRAAIIFRNEPFQPVLIPFIYFVLHLKGQSYKTLEGKLTGIKFLYTYFKENVNIDLDEQLIDKKKYSIILTELNSFIYWLTSHDQILGIRSREIYIRAICEFLIWANKRYRGNTEINKSITDLSNTFIRSLPNSPPNSDSSLSKSQVGLVLKYSNPIITENPFRTIAVKERNFIIINLLLSTGIRLGELLKLKSSDIHELNTRFYLEVINRENESEDTRVDEPGLKNNQSQRIIDITEDLYNAIIEYITFHRRPIRNGKRIKLKHGYLFTSERGLPLSKGSVSDMLKKLKASIIKDKNDFISDLTPHSFRHTFAEQFIENLIEIQGIDMERAKDHLRAIGGWSINSTMPSYYAKKYIAKSANAANIDRINRSLKKST